MREIPIKWYPVNAESMVVETKVKAIRFYCNAESGSGKYQGSTQPMKYLAING